MNNVQQRITEWSTKRRVRQMRDRILALLLTVMMIAGMFASVMPAVAAEEAFCGLEEHTHSDDCYKENRELICELPEDLHVHTDTCYTETRVLKCGQIETEGHIHTDDCYEERTTYICGLEEYEGHTHTDGCYTEQTRLICDNTDPEHEHDESCYITESVLTCAIPESEGHTHTDACLGVEKVLVCGQEEHDPHTHDDTCYTTEIVLSCGLEEDEPEHVHTEDCYKITRELICEQAEHVHSSACFEDASTEMPAFSQSKTVDDIVVSVTAPEGVFPAEATLSVTKVPVQAQTMVDAAVEAERSENVNVAVSYTFDIKVLDAEGYELQPAEGQCVNVSFTLAAAQDSNLKASVYHVDENGAAAILDAETQRGTVTAATDGFSYYTVEFTYQNLQYVLSGGGSVALDTVLSTVGLTGEVTNAYGSNDSLFSVSNSTGEWIVTSHEAFDSTESLMVLINGVEYVITVTDDNTWAGGTIKLEFGFAHPYKYRDVQYPSYTYASWILLPYWDGSATLYDSEGNVVESYTNESRHEFKNLPAGEYTIRLDSLDEGIYSVFQGVHNGAPKSQIIIWFEDSDLLKVTVTEGNTTPILRWVVLEYKVYAFKTVTDIGTFSSAPSDSGTPGAPSVDGKEYVYYGGGSWYLEDYPSAEDYIPYVQTHDGIYWGDHASQYRGMGSLQIPTLSDAEAARGYVFKGWKLEGDDSGKIYTESEALLYTVTGNVVFRAVWELPKCTVTFDPNGGAGNMDSVTVSTGSYTLPENGFTAPAGKAFNGWDRGSAGSNINISENITLLAQWAEDANGDDIPDNKQVLIKYVAGANGSYTGDEYDVFTAVGDEVSIDNVASTGRTAVPNTDYALDKWSNSKNSDTNQTGAFTFGTVDVDTIITVTASFADDNNAILATLTYGTDGNGSVTEWYFGGDATADQTLARDDLQAMIDHFAGNELVGQGLKNADINETGGFNSLDRTLFANLVTNGSSMLPNQDFIFSVTDIPNDGYYVSRVTVNGHELNVPEPTLTSNADTTIDGANYRVGVTWVDGEFVYAIRGTSLAVNDVWIEHSESNKYTMSRATDGFGQITSYRFGGDATVDDVVDWRDQLYIEYFMGDGGPTWNRQFAINACLVKSNLSKDPEERGRVTNNDWIFLSSILSGAQDPYDELSLTYYCFSWEVVDEPIDGYYVSAVSLNNQQLTVPDIGGSATTEVEGQIYTVSINADGVATVSGPNLAANDVWFEHRDLERYTMSRGNDGLGEIISYRFAGDANLDDVVEKQDWIDISRVLADVGGYYDTLGEHPQFLINAEVDMARDSQGNTSVNHLDWIELSRVLSHQRSPHEILWGKTLLDWNAVDKPNEGYYVSRITYNNVDLTVPGINSSATTEVNGLLYTVSINSLGVATVSGPTLETNDVYFAHKAIDTPPWAQGSIGVEFGWVSPDSYRTAMLYPRGAFMSWGGLPYWANGAAELLDSEGNSLGSFTGESSHKFTGLKAGKYILRVTPLKPDSVYNAVESITGVSVITDYETEIEIAEGAAGTIWKYVVVEYKAYAFKTTTEIGTFASGGQAHVYYPGGNWAYENTDPASVSRCATFNTHDGIYYKDTASQYNLSVLEIPTLSEEEAAKGYKFVGWKLVENGDLSEKIYTDVEALSYVVRGDTEFRAVWEYPTHTVSFSTNADCGAINGDTSVSFQMNYNNQTMEGEGIALPEVIVKPGYEFIGWYSDLTTNVIPNETILKTKVDRDLNYYAKYKGSEFTVKYLPGTDGSITSNFDELRLANGTYIPSVPTVKANTGASFTGKWKVVAISDGAALHVGDVLDESDIKAIAVSFDMNLEAQYEKENLTVAFDSDGGTPVDSQNVLSGDKADKPNDPTKDGYTFNGWTLDGREYDFDAPVIENITLVAKWIANTDTGYVVEFYYQSGGEYGTQPDKSEVRSGTTDTEVCVTDADKTPDPAKTGFVLDEVMNDFYTGSINGDGTLVLKVYFKQQFTVVYDPGEHGTWAAADKTISGIDYGKPTPSFSGDTSAQHDAGYTFSGWTPSVADTVTMDVTYVAQWTANEGSQYTVEYYYQENGTYPATASSSVSRTGDVGTEVSITDEDKAPSRSGYAIDETLNDFFTGTVADDGSLVLKVYFKQQFTVVYEPGAHGTWEAASATTEKLNYGVATPAFSGNVSSDHDAGYHFVSWTPSVADTVTANAVYVAQWAADSETRYKVEYYYQVNGVYPQTANKSVDRTGITDKTVQVTAADKTPDRNGYALDNAAANVLSGIVAADGSLVLKVYFKQQFTITYNMNGGTMNGSTASVKETHDYGEVISILKAPTRSGYTFQYWKGSEYQPGENYTVTGDHTFTAQWSANSAKLPKTGQTTWPIPVFTVMGTALIVYGLIRRKKEEKENAS